MVLPQSYVQQFPLIPGGGMFFTPIGVCIVLGTFLRHLRQALVWTGFALGIATISLGGAFFFRGLPAPGWFQIACFAFAIAVEIVAFRTVLPRVRSRGARATQVATLAIVGAHFLIMIPSFGWPIAALAGLCLANAGAAGRIRSYPIGAAWFADGAFKLAIGLLMWSASPVFA